MKCLAICQDELVIRALDQVLVPAYDVEFLVESKPLARRLHEADLKVSAADPRRVDSYLKADLDPGTVILIEDNGRRSLRRIVDAVRDAGGTLIYIVRTASSTRRVDELRAHYPDVNHLSLAELIGSSLNTELSRSLTRARVQQYQRYFADADRVLILLHNEPDPDAMASGLALRNLLRRTKATAIIGALQGMTRPENLRMANLLDIQVEQVTPAQLTEFERIATVDVQPHYFGGLLQRADLVIDHHPEQPGYSAVFKDIRADYGSTCTILTEHLRAVDVNISERTATAMLYAIKSDTLFFARQTNRSDLDAFTYLYPLSDPALIRKMEGAELTLERLEFVRQALDGGTLSDQVYCAYLGEPPREDFITYVADFFLQLEDVKWTIISGQLNGNLVISVRNLGYTRNAAEFVKRWFADIGSAGGHRAMAKAVVPFDRFQAKFGPLAEGEIGAKIRELATLFLGEAQPERERKKESAGAEGPAAEGPKKTNLLPVPGPGRR
jgi:nanoRNase/pAp phosphatase (c-di-AMP/oligoRNAs hydrolase)